MAQRIERRFAGMAEQLSSSIEFLHQEESDPLAGSAALRRAAVAEAEAELLPLDWRGAVDRRPTVRALAVAVVCCVAAVGLAIGFPHDARLAFARLLKPLGDDAWPPVNHLVFTHVVERVARDQPFEVDLIDRNGKLPDDVRIEYRFTPAEGGGQQLVGERMQRMGDLMVARRDRVTQPFDFRAEGGDDRKMPWFHVDVVAPPEIASLRLVLHPPTYTGWPRQPAERRIVALRGTLAEMSGRATKPLAAAMLHLPGGAALPVQVSADGLNLAIAARSDEGWQIDKSGQYWFELRDREGLVGGSGDRWDIQAVADQPPTVVIEQPTGNLMLTAGATISLKIQAKDDIALRSIALVYSRSDHSELGEVALPLFTGPEQPPPTAPLGPAGLLPGDTHDIAYSWELAPLKLPPGTQMLLSVTATDYVPQKGVSPPRRITIITPQQLDDLLAQRQALIYSELGRILKLQQADRLQTSALETQVESVGHFQKQDLDQLRAAELNQRQIHRSLTGGLDSVGALVADLVGQLAANHVDNPDMRRRMTGLAAELKRMDAAELPAAEQDLTAALKATDADAPRSTDATPVSPAGRRALTDAGRDQDAIAAALERLLGDLAEWNSFRGVARELVQVRHDLADVQQATKSLGAQTLTQDVRDLSPQQQADLKKLSERQLDLARQFDKLQGRLEQVGSQLRTSDPLAADSLADALQLARRQAPSGLMNDAARSVEANHIGDALDQQAASGKVLDDMLDILSNRREQELSRLVAKLRAAEGQLAALRKQEDGLRKKLHEAAANGSKAGDAERKAELQPWRPSSGRCSKTPRASPDSCSVCKPTKPGAPRRARASGSANRPPARKSRRLMRLPTTPTRQPKTWKMPSSSWPKRVARPKLIWPTNSSAAWKTPLRVSSSGSSGRSTKRAASKSCADQGQLTRSQAQSVLDLGHQQEGAGWRHSRSGRHARRR